MHQLVLELAHPPEPTLRNFAPGRNAEALAAVARLLAGDLHEPWLYLWGHSGAGKTHLLRAAVQAAREGGGPARLSLPGDVHKMGAAAGEFLAVDDVERLDAQEQAALFSLLNRPADERVRLLLSGAVAPAALALRADVRTRIGAGLVLQLHLLSDGEKADALRAHARERGFELPPDAADYLLRHVPRDLPSLMSVLDAVDELSLREKRPVTAALLRDALQAARMA